MIDIIKCIEYYLGNDYDDIYARLKVAQDILLSIIAESKYNRNVTLKGGIVLFNITKDKRRATEYIDIDLIRYSLEDSSIIQMFRTLSKNELGIIFTVNGKPQELRQQDYKGKRVFLVISDSFGNIIEIKLDIGVQNNLAIEQEEFIFEFEVLNKKISLLINTKEQIFVEKLTSLLKYGIATTRFKDIFDFYYFIKDTQLNKDKISEFVNIYIFQNNKLEIANMEELYLELKEIFENNGLLIRISTTKYNWMNVNPVAAFETILNFIDSLQKIGI